MLVKNDKKNDHTKWTNAIIHMKVELNYLSKELTHVHSIDFHKCVFNPVHY